MRASRSLFEASVPDSTEDMIKAVEAFFRGKYLTAGKPRYIEVRRNQKSAVFGLQWNLEKLPKDFKDQIDLRSMGTPKMTKQVADELKHLLDQIGAKGVYFNLVTGVFYFDAA